MSPKNVIFKKIAKDKSVGVYMGKRDFVDHVHSVEPVDGVILIDPEAIKGRKAYVLLSCVFRYGGEDVAAMGVSFRRELYLSTRQVYPPLQDRQQGIHTKIQGKLLRKLGDNAHPFFFELPDNLPCSVGLQPAPSDVGKHCAVEFEVKAYSAESPDDKVRKRSTVKLLLRKVQYAPEKNTAAPLVKTSKDFVMSDQPLHLEAGLEKETHYHGEPIKVNVNVKNSSNKNVKNIIISVEQVANVVLYSNDSYVKEVAREDSGVKEGVLKEVMGILVSYRIMVKLIIGGIMGSSEIGVEIPFQLMHPKPDIVRESELEEEMVFEEFKRSYLKGMANDEDDGNVSGGDDMAPKEK